MLEAARIQSLSGSANSNNLTRATMTECHRESLTLSQTQNSDKPCQTAAKQYAWHRIHDKAHENVSMNLTRAQYLLE